MLAQLHREVAQLIAPDADDGAHADQRAAPDLPELVRVQSGRQFPDRHADQAFVGGADHARVTGIRFEEQDFVDREHLDHVTHSAADPADAFLLRCRPQALVEFRQSFDELSAAVAGLELGPQAREGLLQPRRGERLEQVIDRAKVEGLDRMAVIGGREDHAAVAGTGPRHLEAAPAGHPDVEEGEVRAQVGDRRERFVAVFAGGHDLQLRLGQCKQALQFGTLQCHSARRRCLPFPAIKNLLFINHLFR